MGVYGILAAQLLVTAAVGAPFVFVDSVKRFLATPSGFPVLIGVTVLNMILLCAMVCPCGCQKNMRRFPLNFILLGAFTLTEGCLVGVCCSMYDIMTVLLAVVLTAALVVVLTLYAKFTKRDFTGFGPYLTVALFGMMFFGLMAMFIHVPMLQKIYCCVGIVLFSFYLIYDAQMIMGKGELALTVDDYVFGALTLYIDIIQIFLYILQMLGGRD